MSHRNSAECIHSQSGEIANEGDQAITVFMKIREQSSMVAYKWEPNNLR
jgi:hypothetical protein